MGVLRYREKPVVIEAMRWVGPDEESVTALAGFMDEAMIREPVPDGATEWPSRSRDHMSYGSIDESDGSVLVHTLEGDMRAGVGDWIIKGVKGEFYPCKPDIFDATYELAS